MKKTYTKIISQIKKYNKFAIFVHFSPDGDAVGSGQALKIALENLGKTAYLCCDDEMPESLSFLEAKFETNEEKINNCDAYFCLDASTSDRFRKYEVYAKQSTKPVLVIDHHIPQQEYGNIVVRKADKSSTCEMVYELICEMEQEITPYIATCLYTGLATDTGCFLHQNTTPSAHRTAADLIEKGADIFTVNLKSFSIKPPVYMQISKLCMKKMQIFGDKLTLVIIKQKEYEKLNKPVSYLFIDALSHYSTDMLVLVTELEKNLIKINTRSRYSDVQELCKKFGGGGHKNAAGANISGDTLKNVVKKLKEEIL